MESEECAICLENLKPDETDRPDETESVSTETESSTEKKSLSVPLDVLELNCKHRFHCECLKKIYRCVCPLCNAEIKEPDEIVASIQANIYNKRRDELLQEERFNSQLIPFQIFLNTVLIFIYNELSEGTKIYRYPIYYRFQSNWDVTQHLSNFMLTCSNLYQQDDWEEISWSQDLDIIRTISQYNENNELVVEYRLKFSDILEESNNAFLEMMDFILQEDSEEIYL
jgi:hypothetical protein